MASGRPYTKTEEKALRAFCRKKELSRIEIAKEMTSRFGRVFTQAGIYNKAQTLGLDIPPKRPPEKGSSIVPTKRDLAIRKKLEKDLEKERMRNEQLSARMSEMVQKRGRPINEYFGASYRFAQISDTHFGSQWERPDLLKKAYMIIKKEGIHDVYHAGDVLEGSGMRKGHEYELKVVGMDKQIAHLANEYPEIKGITTHFILGSHDLSFYKGAGSNPGPAIAGKRHDFKQLGETSCASFPIRIGDTTLTFALEHPRKGSAYALSYQPQKYLDALSGGRKPHYVGIGHYHKAELLPIYRNVIACQSGCFQSQTDWMREGGLAAHLGFWLCEVRATKVGIARFGAEFVPFFEEAGV